MIQEPSIIDVLYSYGVEGYLRGDEPQTEQEFQNSFTQTNNVVMPTWAQIVQDLNNLKQQYLSEYKLDIKKQLTDYYEQQLAKTVGVVPKYELASWPVKEAAAKAYQAGNANQIQLAMLQEEATMLNQTVDIVAQTIITKAQNYVVLSGKIAGQRQLSYSKIDQATTTQELDTLLDSEKQALDALLSSFTGSP